MKARYLVQVLVPLVDTAGTKYPATQLSAVEAELLAYAGGVTTYVRSPARGLWTDARGHTTVDDIVIFEVMLDDVDDSWWLSFRQKLEEQLKQQEIVIRAQELRQL
jgi:hypothetical protein